MNKFTTGIVVTIVAASIIAAWTIHRHAEQDLVERNRKLHDQLMELSRLAEENKRSSDLIARVRNDSALSPDQLHELLKLRNQVSQLRQKTADEPTLKNANNQLRVQVKNNDEDLAAARALPDFWPREQLQSAGHADPDSALKTMLAAIKSGDVKAFEAAMTSDALKGLKQEWEARGLSPERQEQELQWLGNMLVGKAEGFHVVDEQFPADGVAIVNLSFDGQGTSRRFVVRKIGGDWLVAQLLFAKQTYDGN